MDRRNFLRKTTVGVLFLSAAKILPAGHAGAVLQSTVPGSLSYFSPEEFLLMRALASRITGCSFDGETEQIDVAFRADQFLARADAEVQEEFHLLLTLLNSSVFAFLFDFRFSAFVNMSPGDQDAYLQDWMTSIFAFRRTAFQAIKRLSMSMYYTDKRSWHAIGYEGMFLPEDRR